MESTSRRSAAVCRVVAGFLLFATSSTTTIAAEHVLITVPADHPHLATLVAPVAASIKRSGETPLLSVLSDRNAAKTLLAVVGTVEPKRVLSFTTATGNVEVDAPRLDVNRIRVDGLTTRTGLRLATRFWDSCEDAVIVSAHDYEAVVTGGTLAAHLAVPLIPIDEYADFDFFAAVLKRLGVRNLFSVSGSTVFKFALSYDQIRILPIDGEGVASLVCGILGRKTVTNVVLARSPEDRGGSAAWMAPYIALMRRSPVITVRSDWGRQAQAMTLMYIRRHGLKPRNVTIIGSYTDIQTVQLPALKADDYDLDVEPCSGTGLDGASALGVGRLPFDNAADTSLLFLRGLIRESAIKSRRPTALIVANPRSEFSMLPLCETVSRATERDMENAGVKVHGFYQMPLDDVKAVGAAAKRAHLVVYEGHIYDENVFGEREDPPWPSPDLSVDSPVVVGVDRHGDEVAKDVLAPSVASVVGRGDTIDEDGLTGAPSAYPETSWDLAEDRQLLAIPEGEVVDGMPVVLLQSCHSHEELRWRKVLDSGGVALVGSTTSIHSGSGSAYAKVFCNSLAYENATIGEAVRDARNYFLTLVELKHARGHTQGAKGRRVALSFRLWGDPELRAFPAHNASLRYAPVGTVETRVGAIALIKPKRKMREVRTAEYRARIYARQELAGIVKRIKGKTYRRLMPVHFLRVPVPAWMVGQRHGVFTTPGADSVRSVFMTDTFDRYAYILHFPEEDSANRTVELSLPKEVGNGL